MVAREPASAAPPGSATAAKKRGSRAITRPVTASASEPCEMRFSNISAARSSESSMSCRTCSRTVRLR